MNGDLLSAQPARTYSTEQRAGIAAALCKYVPNWPSRHVLIHTHHSGDEQRSSCSVSNRVNNVCDHIT
ncbi:hypothetical protein PAECIP112173_04956 [Paenibacillus sp. JJ-100]|nr:hypothetical protein PAECIP112173_04956 [Paenibacillus sp. JJ-100]